MRPLRASRPRRRGFTLIEMIVATVLLAVAVVGALAAYAAATQSAAHSERLHTAALLAQKHLTELELQSDTLSGGEQQGDFGPEFAEFRWRQIVEPTEFANLYRVTFVVQWGPPYAPRERIFVTFMRSDQNQMVLSPATSTSGGTGNGAPTVP
ncbi:MAG: prepilin-type N-terminal cleavage/methylation domain-containing protein [Chloroherpetonaceae bacterium]|nr:prepilin-type N-terminal cleavage/methylation domain-containing protein [Chthonomonadaceae bacterium]MDW8208929.1 prepilin-type N-terminal cleavage/methylation domain-containing protein [Chloroherpetonaceae bacterium]